MVQLDTLKTAASHEEAALLDMGDGIACLQFRSKGNSISPRVREFIVDILAQGLYDFDGVVVATQGKHFSVGANLVSMRERIEAKNFIAMEEGVAAFQAMTASLRRSKKPIVAAPYRMTLGGGLEVALHCSARVALEKCYMGLVESGVGLLPGGGGTKCCALAGQHLPESQRDEAMLRVFEKLILGQVSKNAEDARQMLYLTPADLIVQDEDALIDTAKAHCLSMVREGYMPPEETPVLLPGKRGYDLLLRHGAQMLEAQKISAYDLEIGKKIALVLAGSRTEGPRAYTEQEILALERRGFVELTQSEPTYQRIVHFLDTNEKLKN